MKAISLRKIFWVAISLVSKGAYGLTWEASMGYALASGQATSQSSGRASRTESLFFPTMAQFGLETGTQQLRFILENMFSYSPSQQQVEFSVWSVGLRWIQTPISGNPQSSIVSIGSYATFHWNYELALGVSSYNATVRNRDGLLTKVTAQSFGGFVGGGVYFPLESWFHKKVRFEEQGGYGLLTNLRYLNYSISYTNPTLETSIFQFLLSLRYQF
jgi:hypothetical protein